MPRRNARERLQKQVVIRRLEEIFGNLDSVVPPETSEHVNILHGLSDKQIIVLAGDNLPPEYVHEILMNLPVTLKDEVMSKYYASPYALPLQSCPIRSFATPHAYVAIVNALHSFQMTYDECLELFPTCTPKWFGWWFAPVTVCHDCKFWLPQIQEPEEEQIQEESESQEESEGFQTCDEAEPDEEP